MNHLAVPTLDEDENLVAELHRLNVRHLARFAVNLDCRPLSPVNLIAALATHPDARLQAALILLFLRRPDYQRYLSRALEQLNPADQLTLKLYYQAAVYLQRELTADLACQAQCNQVLTDNFSMKLSLLSADTIRPGLLTAQAALDALGARHQQHSGWQFNWAGSYRQNIPLFLKHLGTRVT
jgi:hypothetical protein